MQTLGLSDSTPRSENRLKSLFWPAVESATDVDYLGTQGYWVCTIVAALRMLSVMAGYHPILGTIFALYFYLGAVGVRERSRYAAISVLVMYTLDTLFSGTVWFGMGIARIFLTALLLSNVRATWIASGWQPGTEEATLPPRFDYTLADKFADTLPQWLWPKSRVFYYILSVGMLLLIGAGLIVRLFRS